MPQDIQSAKDLLDIKIKVQGTPIVDFGDLTVDEYMNDTGAFSFSWFQKSGVNQFSNHESFFRKNLGSEVQIEIGTNFIFKGIICAIHCLNQDQLGVEYSLSGKGLLVKLDGPPVCHSFADQKLSDLFGKIFSEGGLQADVSASFTDKINYTVQYNQSPLEFARMLAIRYGEWLYYNGEKAVVKKPAGSAVLSLEEDATLFDLQFSGQLVYKTLKGASFDITKAEDLMAEKSQGSYGGLLNAAVTQGGTVYKSNGKQHVGMGIDMSVTNKLAENALKANQINGVTISGTCYSPACRVGSKVSIKSAGGSLGDYIVTEVHHRCNADQNYINSFSAVDANATVPPYANPDFFPICMPQPAVVTNNMDKDGKLDRVKVRFPWGDSSKQEESCWIPVLTPYAGDKRGFRILPEIGDLVMVAFIDNNAERPYVMGSLYNNKAKSGIDEKDNDIKSFVTKGKGKIEWNDKEGTLNVEAQEIITIQLVNKEVAITLDNKNKKFKIDSNWDIDIATKGNMKLSATKNVDIEGTGNVTVKGMKMALEAQGTFEAKGVSAKLEGSAKVEVTGGMASLKGSGIAEISGTLVKIN